MRIWKSSLLIIGLSVLLLSSMSALAETDETGDLYHQIVTDTGLNWEPYLGEKSYIDITDISYSIADSQATLTMTLADDIMSNAFISYYMHLRTDEAPLYTATYSDGYASIIGPGGPNIIDNPISGKIFTTTFDITDPNLEYTVWGWAGEFTDEANQQTEGWLDYAPGIFAPWYTGDDDTGGDDTGGDDTGNGGAPPPPAGTPGFETLAVIAALGVAFIILRRKK